MASFEAETLGGVKKTFKKAAELIGVGYGAAELFKFGKEAATDAAHVQKSQELIRAEFGKSGEALIKWADDAGVRLGVAAHESESTAARFGVLFHNMGIGQQQAATMSLNLEKLAGSLAAARGIDAQGVFERLPIALAGNIRGLKQLGISIDATSIKQTALALGFTHSVGAAGASQIAQEKLAIAQAQYSAALAKYGAGTTQVAQAHIQLQQAQAKATAGVKEAVDALTPAQRAQVIYTIAMKNLDNAQQTANAHSQDAANVQRRLSAEWDHAREVIGTALLPVITRYGGELAVTLDKLDKSGRLQKDVNNVARVAAGIFQALATAVNVAWHVFEGFSSVVGGTKNATLLLVAAWGTFKIGSLVSSITGMIGKMTGMTAVTTANTTATLENVAAADADAIAWTRVGGAMVATRTEAALATGALETQTAVTATAAASTGGLVGRIGALLGGLGKIPTLLAVAGGAWMTYESIQAAASSNAVTMPDGSVVVPHGGRYLPGTGGITTTRTATLPGNDRQQNIQASKNRAASYRAGIYSQAQVRQLLLQAGADPALATNLSIISARGEDASGDPTRLNNNPGTGDYSIGLFQENFLGRMGVSRTAKYAPQFGLSPTTPVKAFVSWLGQHPAAQAKIAMDIFNSQGYGAWTTAAGLGIRGGGSTPAIDYSAMTGGGGGGGTTPLTVGQAAPTVAKMTAQQLAAAKRSLDQTYAAIKDTVRKNGGELTAKIRADMTTARKDISDVATTSDISKARDELTTLRRTVTDHLALVKQQIANTNTFAGFKAQVAALGPDVLPGVVSAMANVRKEISDAVTPREVAKVKTDLATLKAAIGENKTFDGLQAEANKIGSDVGPAITNAIAKIRAEMGKMITPATVAKVKSEMEQLKTAISTQAAAIKAQAEGIRNSFEGAFGRVASAADNAFDRATNKALSSIQTMVNAGGSSFNFGGDVALRPAGQALARLAAQHESAAAAKQLSDAQFSLTQAQAKLSSIMAPATVDLTKAQLDFNSQTARLAVEQEKLSTMIADPAKYTEAQVAVQQAAIDQLQNTIGDTRASFLPVAPTQDDIAAAQQAVVDAQAQVDDALYNQKVSGLQAQATLEHNAAQTALTDAQGAYSDQRALLKQSMDDRVAAIETGMEDGTISAKDGMDQLTAIFGDPQYGIDVKGSALVIAGAFYTGLDKGLVPVFALFDKLAAKMREIGLLPSGAPGSGAGGGGSTPNVGIGALLGNGGVGPGGGYLVPGFSTNPDGSIMSVDDVAAAFAAANQPVVDELQAQTAILSNTTPGGKTFLGTAVPR